MTVFSSTEKNGKNQKKEVHKPSAFRNDGLRRARRRGKERQALRVRQSLAESVRVRSRFNTPAPWRVRRIQTLRAFRRTQGRPEGRCLSIFQNWKSQNVQNGSSESAASVTDGHQIGRKMRPNPVQIRGKNGKNREKIAKHAHTDVKILACWVQGWFLSMSLAPFGAFLGPSWEPKIDEK